MVVVVGVLSSTCLAVRINFTIAVFQEFSHFSFTDITRYQKYSDERLASEWLFKIHRHCFDGQHLINIHRSHC